MEFMGNYRLGLFDYRVNRIRFLDLNSKNLTVRLATIDFILIFNLILTDFYPHDTVTVF